MSATKSNGGHPAITDKTDPTFRPVSWGGRKRINMLQLQITETKRSQDYGAAVDALQMEVCKYILDVPRNWLVDDAPDISSWSDATALDWLQADRWKFIIEKVSGVKAEEEAKN